MFDGRWAGSLPLFVFLMSLVAIQDATAQGQTAQAQTAPSAVASGNIEEVVITATQRPSFFLDIPASVSVLTADRLAAANVGTLKQLVSLAPGMGVVNSIGETFGQLIRVRGIATSGADVGLESAAGVTVDGVPLARPSLAILDLQGIDRIEFLRGPQGTLFGKNTTAGVLNILTQRPTFDPQFEASASYGEREHREMRVTTGGGLVGSKLAGRIDALLGSSNGYLRNLNTGRIYGGRDREQIRAQLLWTPHTSIDARMVGDYVRHDGTINGPVYRVVGGTGAPIASLTGLPLIASMDATDLTQIDDATPRFDINESAGLMAEVIWGSEIGELTAITSYRSTNFDRSYDVDNSPAELVSDPRDGEQYNTASLELRFQGRKGPLDYLFGAYTSREIIRSRDSFRLGDDFEPYVNALSGGFIPAITGLPAGSNFPAQSGILDVFHQRATNFSLFTHHIVEWTDRLSLTMGLRYSWETKKLAAQIASDNPGCAASVATYGPALAGVPGALQGLICIPNLDPRYDGSYDTERDEADWSGTAAIVGKLSEHSNAYLSYSRGFKAGGFQLDRSGMDPITPALGQVAFGAETVDSIEIGLKAISPTGDWRANAAMFFSEFGEYQFSFFTGLNRRTINVPELVTKGFEIEAAYQPIASLTLSAAAAYQEVIFGSSGFPDGLTQLQGSTSPIAPRWVLVGTASTERALADTGLDLFGHVDLRWQSRSNVGASAAPTSAFLQDPYAVVGARVGITDSERSWKIEFWGRNLFDQRAWAILNNTTLQPGSISGYVTDARSLGVTATLRW